MKGRVFLVGAGPGDPDLLTLRAARELSAAEVLLYDALVDPAILEFASERCERIDVGKRGDGSRGVSQDRISELMIEKARAGKRVVRLKGGDPFVFGRGGEEASALAKARVPFEVVPGISSAIAAPGAAGIPVTDRRLASSVAIVTGHRGKDAQDRRNDWEALARSADTLVVLMGTAWLEDIVARVIRGGRDPGTPAAVIERGMTPGQRVVCARLEDLPREVRAAGLAAPTVIVIGEVVRFRDELAWFESRPLFGRRVLVTRAQQQARTLCRELRRRGAEPVRVPLLAFEPVKDRGPLEAALARIDVYDWLVFASANAVHFSGIAAAPRRTEALRVACIGAATADAARETGLRVDVMPEPRSLPEDLAAAIENAASLAGARVLLPRAEAGLPTLRRALELRGAKVDDPVVYRTAIPEGAGKALREAVDGGLDAVLLASPSSVAHLAALLGSDALASLSRSSAFFCIGPTTAAALRREGVEPTAVSEEQHEQALVDALERWALEEPSDAVS
ncbi:MAG: uroporphyrinogen-III C-methyltransferase [Myxococcales bacterium]|nr:uroporphyrinogen-III C-methyltransferase [Myxococcales bacterium]